MLYTDTERYLEYKHDSKGPDKWLYLQPSAVYFWSQPFQIRYGTQRINLDGLVVIWKKHVNFYRLKTTTNLTIPVCKPMR